MYGWLLLFLLVPREFRLFMPLLETEWKKTKEMKWYQDRYFLKSKKKINACVLSFIPLLKYSLIEKMNSVFMKHGRGLRYVGFFLKHILKACGGYVGTLDKF